MLIDKLQLKRSNKTVTDASTGTVSPKLPNPSDLDNGELALNYADGYETLAFKNDNGEIKTFSCDEINITQIINVTYSELVELRNNNLLKTGQYYRMIDYATVTTQIRTHGGYTNFDIILFATSKNTLNENVLAIKKETSSSTEHPHLNTESWEIKYSLDNDNERFAWVNNVKTITFNNVVYEFFDNDTTPPEYPIMYIWSNNDSRIYTYERNPSIYSDIYSDFIEPSIIGNPTKITHDSDCKGVIYYMKDEFGNEAPYDFKSISFKCYGDTTLDSGISYVKNMKSLSGEWLTENVSTSDSFYCDTFQNRSSVDNNRFTEQTTQGMCHNCVIKPYFIGKQQWLNNIVVFYHDTNTYHNEDIKMYFGDNCHDILNIDNNRLKFGDNCTKININPKCTDSVFEDNVTEVSINSSLSAIKNINVERGLSGVRIVHTEENDDYQVTYRNANSVIVNVQV